MPRWVLLLLLVVSPASADEDRDGDGIADGVEACPTEPETTNAFKDEDGCPDTLVQLNPTDGDHARVVILFRKGSAALRVDKGSAVQRHDAILDEIAKVMGEHPELTLIEVLGHASADERRAQQLGQRRAEAVLQALVSRGVERKRLVAHSAGATKPLSRGKHDGRNRRVEFVVRERVPPDAPH